MSNPKVEYIRQRLEPKLIVREDGSTYLSYFYDEDAWTLIKHIDKINAELENLQDENKSLQFNLEQKAGQIGRSEHRGNTVDYIYDKCVTYGKQFDALSDELKRTQMALEKCKEQRNEYLNLFCEYCHNAEESKLILLRNSKELDKILKGES